MAKLYFEKLSRLVSDLDIENEVSVRIDIRHFFSGAALYADDVICVSWSPDGLAFKLSKSEVDNLLTSKKAKPLKYFKNGYIKTGYAMFENPESSATDRWKNYFYKAIDQVL